MRPLTYPVLGALIVWSGAGIAVLGYLAGLSLPGGIAGEGVVPVLMALALVGGVLALRAGVAYLRKDTPLVASLRDRADAAMERMADAVRDALLDWNTDDDLPPEVAREPLPPVDPGQFVEVLRPEVEQTLAALAEVLNEAPDARSLPAGEPEVRRLLEGLVRQALERGRQLRIDAAVAGLPPGGPWVEKYRRMQAAEGRLPAASSAHPPD
jgi:hypothetical protein